MSPAQAALAALRVGCGDLLAWLGFGPVSWSEIARAGLIGQAELAGKCGLAVSASMGEDLDALRVTLTPQGWAVRAGIVPELVPVAGVAVMRPSPAITAPNAPAA